MATSGYYGDMPLQVIDIENIKKVTPLGAFFYDALLLQTYGPNLFWEDQSTMTWCLRCTHKKKKDYSKNVEKIFKDYSIFKKKENKKRTKPDGDKDLRTNLLNAIKKNPYIRIDEERSSNDEKFCSFTNRFKTVCGRVLRQAQLVSDEMTSTMVNIDSERENTAFEIPLLDESVLDCMDPGEMFTNPLEELLDSLTGRRLTGEDVNLNSLNYEDPFVNDYSSALSRLDYTDVEPHDDQFCPLNEESIFLSNNHYMVTQTDDQPQKTTGGLKVSRT